MGQKTEKRGEGAETGGQKGGTEREGDGREGGLRGGEGKGRGKLAPTVISKSRCLWSQRSLTRTEKSSATT